MSNTLFYPFVDISSTFSYSLFILNQYVLFFIATFQFFIKICLFYKLAIPFLLPQFTCFNLTKQANNEKLQKRLHEYYINLSEDEKIKK